MTSAKNAFALVETDMIASRESAQNVELSNILSSVRAVIVSAKIVYISVIFFLNYYSETIPDAACQQQ